MEKINKKTNWGFYQILISILILIFFPFPSKIIGYSKALYICDIALMLCLIMIMIRNRFKIRKTNSLIFLGIFFMLNILGIIIGVIKNGSSLRQFTELIRNVEWIVIYIFFNNIFSIYSDKYTNSGEEIEKTLKKVFSVIYIVLIPFIIIELFNLPGKDILRNFYEFEKSGNIFQYYNRIVGPFRNPNMLGIWTVIFVEAVFCFNYKPIVKVLMLISGLGIIYFTGSRTAMIIIIIIIGIVFIKQLTSKKNVKNISKYILVLIIVAIMLVPIIEKNSQLFYSIRFNNINDSMEDIGGRTDIWNKYMQSIEDNLLLGNGIVKSDDIIFDNLYIQYIYYYGLIGLATLAVFFIRNLYNAWKLYKKGKEKTLALLMILIQITIIIAGITVQILDTLQIFFFYIMSMAYIDVELKKLSKNNADL